MNDTSAAIDARRLVVVSNRLPYVLNRATDGWSLHPGSGGLVSALAPALSNRGGMWIGWPGITDAAVDGLDDALARVTKGSGYTLKPVMLTPAEKEQFYQGFSNEIVWPLFHDLQTNCNFNPGYWAVYETVNRKFAHAIRTSSRADDFVWVHDYHLMNVARELRREGARSPIAFFLHIPFPPLDIFLKLPWRFQVLHALLEYDLIGFQTLRDRRNFIQCLRTLVPGATVLGKGQVIVASALGHDVRLGAFPIGIDYSEFARRAVTEEVLLLTGRLRADLPDRHVVLGIDRLDYTKGITLRLEGMRQLLARYPELHRHITLIQVVVPSREDIRQYHDLKMEIEQLVGEINGHFTQPGWVPIHYLFRNLSRVELLAYYRAADIALVTPLKDGMNLVAKEFCAANVDERGVLVLSEFAGAAAQLQKGALLVNPFDVEGTADAIARAVAMSAEERRARMRKLRRSVRDYDIFWWLDSFLRAAIAKELSDFPLPEEYIPQNAAAAPS